MESDLQTSSELDDALLAHLPLFPLPQAVLFPGVVMPLHFFEPRYRALAEACVAGPRAMAVATLMPGFDATYEGRPPVYPIATVGTIVAQRRHPDGRWDIALRGVARVELQDELPPGEAYRVARAQRVREIERKEDRVPAEWLRSAAAQIANLVPGLWPQLAPALVAARTPAALADVLAGTFVEAPDLRRYLLDELVVATRLTTLEGALAQVLLDVTVRHHADDRPAEWLLN